LNPETVYITEEYGGPSDFPDNEGKFPSLERANHGAAFTVEGDSFQNVTSHQANGELPGPSSQVAAAQPGAFRRSSLP